MQHIKSERELVNGVLRGDARYEEALYRQFSITMFKLCLRYAGDRSEAEDMLQEGFIRVFADLQDYRFQGSLEGWIRRVVVRAALRQLRQKRCFAVLEDLPDQYAEDAETMQDEPVLRSGAAYVAQLMQQLPAGYRTVLNLYAIEGYTHEEIAGLLGISTGTSKSQLFKARTMMKNLVEKIYTHV
jgi:RNA polymerase sigma factor (sigma-70 family)